MLFDDYCEWSSALSPLNSTLLNSNKKFIIKFFLYKYRHFFENLGLKRGVSKFS